MKKWLSRNVVLNGRNLGLAIVVDNEDGSLEVEEFVKEESGVSYVDTSIVIDTSAFPHLITFINNTHPQNSDIRK